jgi:hypothetical protein
MKKLKQMDDSGGMTSEHPQANRMLDAKALLHDVVFLALVPLFGIIL